MTRIKRSLGRALLHIISFMGFGISIALAPIIILFWPVRGLMFTISLKNDIWEKVFPVMVKGALFFFYMQIAVGLPAAAVSYLGIEHLFDGIVTAGIIIVFVALQLPRMLPPYFGVHFVPSKRHSILVKPGVETDLHLSITNLGLTVFKNCLCNVRFEDKFKVIDGPNYNYKVAYNHDAIFTPDKNFLTVSPCSHLIFGIRIQAPSEPGNYKVRVLLDSETTWGTAEQSLNINVSTNK